jgi:hypothetical protein
MSITAMKQVWEHAQYEGGALLLLLALADHANADNVCWPSVELLSRKARLGIRQTHKLLAIFKTDGVLLVQSGGGRGRSSRYTLVLETLNYNSLNPRSPKSNSLKSATETLQSNSENPEFCDSAIKEEPSRTVLEPSGENRDFVAARRTQISEIAKTLPGLASRLLKELDAGLQRTKTNGSEMKNTERIIDTPAQCAPRGHSIPSRRSL